MTKLLEHLNQSGTSQAKLARAIGASQSYVCELASGVKTPGLTMAVRIQRFTKGAVPADSWVPEDTGAELSTADR